MGQFITPPSIPEDVYCRRLLIPNTPEWIGTVTGALMIMIYESEWKQTTGISADDAAERANLMFQQYLVSGDDGECGDMNNCCPELVIIHRFNPDTGRPEVSDDGGETWTPDPNDPQNAIPLLPPLTSGGSGKTKCDAATNASEHFNELITEIGTNLTTAVTVFDLSVAIAEAVLALVLVLVSAGALTPIVTAVATAVWGAATALFALGIEAYNTYWTTDKKDAVLCAIYCNIGEDGQFTDAQYNAFVQKIKDTLPASAALNAVMSAVNAGGARGMSQMASYGNAAEADCSSCDCGTCATEWTIGNIDGGASFGTINSVTDGVYNVSAQLFGGDGHYYLTMKTPSEGDCCQVEDVTSIAGAPSAGAQVIVCPNAQTGANVTAVSGGTLVNGDFFNYIAFNSTVPFTIEITMG